MEQSMNREIPIGRLLRANLLEFVVGCQVSQIELPTLGALVQAPLNVSDVVYGLIYDIHIDDDGLVRQLVTSGELDENVISDNRLNRNVPLEMSVLCIGHRLGKQISHLSPPRPPLSLDVITLCDDQELCRFTSEGRFGYFRHILRREDLATEEILAAHLRLAHQAHLAGGDPGWLQSANLELIRLLRDDYTTLMRVLGAIADIQAV
jgi:hypothetical protein